eukprot:5362997-Pleurochrysis_carterae.AAC.1
MFLRCTHAREFEVKMFLGLSARDCAFAHLQGCVRYKLGTVLARQANRTMANQKASKASLKLVGQSGRRKPNTRFVSSAAISCRAAELASALANRSRSIQKAAVRCKFNCTVSQQEQFNLQQELVKLRKLFNNKRKAMASTCFILESAAFKSSRCKPTSLSRAAWKSYQPFRVKIK